MEPEKLTRPSHLFIVRVWQTTLDNGQAEWRGQVNYVFSEERRYFRDWESLVTHLLSMLQDYAEM